LQDSIEGSCQRGVVEHELHQLYVYLLQTQDLSSSAANCSNMRAVCSLHKALPTVLLWKQWHLLCAYGTAHASDMPSSTGRLRPTLSAARNDHRKLRFTQAPSHQHSNRHAGTNHPLWSCVAEHPVQERIKLAQVMSMTWKNMWGTLLSKAGAPPHASAND
jgi:hypothetical protein